MQPGKHELPLGLLVDVWPDRSGANFASIRRLTRRISPQSKLYCAWARESSNCTLPRASGTSTDRPMQSFSKSLEPCRLLYPSWQNEAPRVSASCKMQPPCNVTWSWNIGETFRHFHKAPELGRCCLRGWEASSNIWIMLAQRPWTSQGFLSWTTLGYIFLIDTAMACIRQSSRSSLMHSSRTIRSQASRNILPMIFWQTLQPWLVFLILLQDFWQIYDWQSLFHARRV